MENPFCMRWRYLSRILFKRHQTSISKRNIIIYTVLVQLMNMKPTIKLLNWFAVFYTSFALLLITLNPFKFQWLASDNGLDWHFSRFDFVQNILLFFPLGVVLQQAVKRPKVGSILYGTLLSAFIEVIQLSALDRTSDYCDIVSNTCGTFFGFLFASHAISTRSKGTKDVTLAFMLMLLCWVTAMRSQTQGVSAWLVMPLAIVGFSVLKSCLLDNHLKWATLLVWIMFSLMPLIYISSVAGIVTLIIVPLIAWVLSSITIPKHRFCLWLLCLSTILMLTVNIIWFESKSSISWTVPAHLHWMETIMSCMVVMAAWIWKKQTLSEVL
jgi:glycopeptide antibiotics resistance protein